MSASEVHLAPVGRGRQRVLGVECTAVTVGRVVPVDAHDVEHEVDDSDRRIAVEDAVAQERPVRRSRFVEGDELAVEHEAARELLELGHALRHVPRAPAAHLEPRFGRDDRPDPVVLELERPPVTARDRAGPEEHRRGSTRRSVLMHVWTWRGTR